MRARGFTLIEMMLAITILGIMTVVAAISFTTVLKNWSKSEEAVDRMQGAEYMLTQVIAGLRSAYYPNDGKYDDKSRGLMLNDGGEGEEPDESDTITWTKLGGAIVGDKSQLAETAHRVSIWVSEKGEGNDETPGLYARVWEETLRVTDDMSEKEQEDERETQSFLLAEDVVGLDCQVQKDTDAVDSEGKPEWKETWDDSNSVPFRVKLTFWLKPPEGDKEPIPIIRVLELPVWELSQGKITTNKDEEKIGGKKSGSSEGGSKTTGSKTNGGNSNGGNSNGGANRTGQSGLNTGGSAVGGAGASAGAGGAAGAGAGGGIGR